MEHHVSLEPCLQEMSFHLMPQLIFKRPCPRMFAACQSRQSRQSHQHMSRRMFMRMLRGMHIRNEKMKSQESMKIPSQARPQAQAFLPQVQQSLPNRHRTQMGFPRTRRSKRQLFWQSLSLLKRLGNGKGYGYMMVYVYAVFLSF